MNNDEQCCIARVLKVIAILQCKAEKIDDIPNTCERPFLGENLGNGFIFNTRPITIFNCNNLPITMPFNSNGLTGQSSVFRVEKVEGCCATLRVLAPNPESSSELPFVATEEFFILRCECACAVRCLNDTFVCI